MMSFGRMRTILQVFFWNLRGRNITVGKDSVISSKAMILGHNITIGYGCYVGSYTLLDATSGSIAIGNKTTLGLFCVLHGGCTIGDHVRVASHVIVMPNDHKYKDKNTLIKNQGATSKGITIGSDVWVSAGVKILDGAKIGEGCVIGAGSVVKNTLDQYGVYVGAPARKISERG